MRHLLSVPDSRRLPTRMAAALCLALVLAGCGGVPGLGGSSRSEENFCQELKAGNERMKEHYTSAGKDVPSQLTLIAQEVGEYTRLVHRLDEAAPEEIKTEMHDSRETWDKQADNISTSDPLGMLASGLMSAMMSSASMAAVDKYAKSHCGTLVFSMGAPQVKQTAGPDESCPDVGFNGTYDPTDPDMSFDDFRSGLESLASSSDDSVSSAAELVLAASDDLDPAPSYATEALGRMAFENPDAATQLLSDLNSAAEKLCQGNIVNSDWVEGLPTTITPRQQGDALVTGNSYGRCQYSLGWVEGKFVQFCDDSGDIAVLDPGTGVFDQVTLEGMEPEPPDGAGMDPDYVGESDDEAADEYAQPFVTMDGVAWISTEFTPAEGINDPVWTATLHYDTLDGSEVFAVQVAKGNAPERAYAEATGTLASAVVDVDGRYRAFGPSGSVLWQKKVEYDTDTKITPTAHTLALQSDSLWNSATGAKLGGGQPWADEGTPTDACQETTATDDAIIVDPLSGSPRAVALGQDVDRGLSGISVAADDVLLGAADGDGLTGWNAAGRKLWRLSEEVVDDWWVLGRWVIVTNAAGETVVVDARTGRDVTAAQTDVTDLVGAAQGQPESLAVAADGSLLFGFSSPDSNADTIWVSAPVSVCDLT